MLRGRVTWPAASSSETERRPVILSAPPPARSRLPPPLIPEVGIAGRALLDRHPLIAKRSLKLA
jgi:hypothetical protein